MSLENDYPELFEAARFLRACAIKNGGSADDVRLRCIVSADGAVIAGKLPAPNPAHWVESVGEGAPVAVDVPTGYRGKARSTLPKKETEK